VREGESGRNEAGERERVRAGLKGSWGTWPGFSVCMRPGFSVCMRGSAAVRGGTELTGRSHGAEREREREREWSERVTALMGGAR
jgi:hypothetical protein